MRKKMKTGLVKITGPASVKFSFQENDDSRVSQLSLAVKRFKSMRKKLVLKVHPWELSVYVDKGLKLFSGRILASSLLAKTTSSFVQGFKSSGKIWR